MKNSGMSSRMLLLCAAALSLVLPVATSHASVRVCAYNLMWYDSGSFAGRDPSFRLILNAINPDILLVEEVSNTAAMENFRDNVLNEPGGPGNTDPYTLATFSNTSDAQDIGLFFRESKFSQVNYVLIPASTAPRPAHRWRLRPDTDLSGNNDIYVYGMHLDATDEPDRNTQAIEIRANANALPAGSMIIYGGDYNIDGTSDLSYQRFTESTADNDGRAWDPLNPNGLAQTWSNSAGFAFLHTQSPHNNNGGAEPVAVAGGMDDRFDLLLMSSALHDGSGQDYIANSYKAFGNDGQHFNNDINDPPTIPQGAAMADALHAASDHIPVYADLTDLISQPLISTTPASFVGFPQVLTGTSVTADVTVTNPATPPSIILQYSFNQPAGFAAPVGTFNLAAGNNAIHTITLNASATSGSKFGTLSITNNSATNPKNLNLIGVVLDHAVPSTQSNAIVTNAGIDFGTHDIGQFTNQTATIHNATVPQFPNKVDLSIPSGLITNDAQGRFSLVGFAPPLNAIASSASVAVHFNDTGAAPGVYTATLTFTTHDDTLAVGGTALASVVFNLQATVQSSLSNPEIDAPSPLTFPDVLVGASVDANLTVSNPAAPPGIALDFSFSAPAGFSAPPGNFQLASGDSAQYLISLTDTSNSGLKTGTLVINNNSATNPANVSLSGLVRDHAVPSTESNAVTTTGLIDFGSVLPGGTPIQNFTVFNATVAQFADPVDLSIDSAQITDDAQGRYSLVAFAPPITGIDTSAIIAVQFDATGATAGTHTATLTLNTSDDSSAVGAGELSAIVINLQASVPAPLRGDFDFNLVVGIEDVDPFVTVLLAPENVTLNELWIADMNEDAVINAMDLQPFVDAVLN